MWEAFSEIVYNDRERNAETAEQARLAGHGVGGVGNEDNAGTVKEPVKSLCNKKYWQLPLNVPSHSTAKANDGVQLKEVHITNDEELTSQHAILDAIEIGECDIKSLC